MGIFKNYFFNKEEMTQKEYSYAKAGFIVDTAANSTAANLVGGTYKVALLALLGATEAESSLIMSLATAASLVSLLVPVITKNMVHKKPLVMLCRFFDKLPMALIFLLPFIFGIDRGTVPIVAAVALIGYIFSGLSTSVHSEWLMKCLKRERNAGKYNGMRIAIYYAVMVISYFVTAQIIGRFTGDKEIYGYMWLAIIALVIWAINITVMFFVKEPYSTETKKQSGDGFFKSMKTVITSKQMRPYFLYNILSNTGASLMSSLVNIMCVQRFKMPVVFITYLTMGGLIFRVFFSPVVGKLVDRFGARKLMATGALSLSVSYIFYAFMNPDNMLITKIFAMAFFAIAWAMLDVATTSFSMECVPENNRSSYLACASSMFSFMATGASWLTTWYISFASGFGLNIFGIDFSEMNLVFIVGSLLIFTGAMYLFFQKKKLDN